MHQFPCLFFNELIFRLLKYNYRLCVLILRNDFSKNLNNKHLILKKKLLIYFNDV